MKTKIISIVVMLLMAVNAMAQDYLTVFFKDGKTESFYMRAVNKFYTSKYDSLGVFHDDYQTQVIETTKNTFSYALTEIDSVSFSKFNEEEVKKNFISAISASSEVFSKCDSISDLAQYIDELRENEGIEYVSYDDHCLFVGIKDWLTMVYCFDAPIEVQESQAMTQTMKRGKTLIQQYGSPYYELSAIEAFALSSNGAKADDWNKYFRPLKNEFQDCSIYVTTERNPGLSNNFYTEEIFQHDLVYYQSHGGYDKVSGLHSLQTADEFKVTGLGYELTDQDKNDIYNQIFSLLGVDIISLDEIYIGGYKDLRPGEGGYVKVWGAWITDKYIENSPKRFKEPAIVFICACQSLAGNPRMADIFTTKGAIVYIGSERSQSSGSEVGKIYFENLLNGMSLYKAFDDISPFTDIVDFILANYTAYYPYPAESKKKFHLFNVYTRNVDSNKAQQEYSETGKVTVSGVTTLLDKDKPKVEFGFKYGTDKNNLSKTKKGKYDSSITDELGNFCFTVDLEMSNNQNLYYQAYTYDGYCYNLGEPKQITIRNPGEDTRSLAFDYELEGTRYALYWQSEQNDVRYNADHTPYYRTKFTLDVTNNGSTKTYMVDENVYYTKEGGGQIPCMAIDLKSKKIFIFVNSSNGYSYSLDGYCFVSPLYNYNFQKEIVFSEANFGWWPYFTYNNGKLYLQHFSFAGYYAMTSTRSSNGTWTTDWGYQIYPDEFKTLSEQAGRVLIIR